jgi:hypothetical protein
MTIRAQAPADTITCPRCGMTSTNPNDIAEGYCANCHDWTQPRRRPGNCAGEGVGRGEEPRPQSEGTGPVASPGAGQRQGEADCSEDVSDRGALRGYDADVALAAHEAGEALLDDELLTDRQRHGIACAHCGAPGGAMRPIGYGPLGQLFIHEHDCERPF